MMEEPIKEFPLPNEYELVQIYIKSELENAGIELQQFTIDDTVITNKEVPKDVKSKIWDYANDKGIDIKFKVSGQEN